MQNLELRIALKPRGGWIDKTKVVLESLAGLLILALVTLLVNLVESRRAVEARLTEVTQRLSRENAGRSQALSDSSRIKERMTATQAELKQTELALEQAKSKVTQIQGLLDASTRERDETVEVHQAEQKEAHAALVKAQETIAQLQERLNAAIQAENKATSTAEERLKQNQTAAAELPQAAMRSARDTAETGAATLAQLEHSKRESKERLLAVERAEGRITELTELLQKAQEELRHRHDISSKDAGAPPMESDRKASCPGAEASPRARLSSDASKASRSASGLSSVAESSSKLATEEPTPVSNRNMGLSSAEPITLVAAQGTAETTLEVASPAEPSVAHRPASKAPKRRKERRDNQMDLFKREDAKVQATNPSAVKVADPALEAKKSIIPEIAIVAAPGAPSSDQATEPVIRAGSEGLLRTNSKAAGPKPQPTVHPAIPAAEVQPATGAGPLALLVVEGLATSEGLANADNDPKHYLKALQQFTQEHANAPERIREGLVQGDVPAAQRVLLALKTAAEKIGATHVQRATTALAHACRGGADPSEIESLWVELEKVLRELLAGLKPVVQAKEDKSTPARRLPAAPPVDLPQLRKAVNQIVPLLTDQDPGAKDCLKDNRSTFRSAFTPEGYVEFEQLVKSGNSDTALEQLKKAVRKQGIAL